MKHNPPGECPVCGNELTITKLSCSRCRTTLEGNFAPCKFCRLPADQMEFIEVFIRSRGNIKEVEKELGISYPTVRNRLDGIIQALGYRVENESDEVEKKKRMEILAHLEKGEIDSREAARQLKNFK